MCTLRVFKPSVLPVASRNLFFDLQEVTLLLGEYTLFALQISTTPLPGYVHIFQQYLQHSYVSIHVRRDVREALGGCRYATAWSDLQNFVRAISLKP